MNKPETISFDGWVLHTELGELVKGTQRIRLQQRPLLVLDELLRNPGNLVTREQLIARLWPKGVVDFDTGLNTAVRKLRVALDDVGDVPRYIETFPRKGYRFVGKIDPAATPAPPEPAPAPATHPTPATEPVVARVEPPSPTAPVSPPIETAIAPITPRRRLHFAVAAGVAIVVAGIVFVISRRDAPPPSTSVTVARPVVRDVIPVSVLPFRSETEADATLAKISADLLAQRLGRLGDALVIDATSIARTPEEPAELRKLATSLHARYLLGGTVVRDQEQVRVTVDLIDAQKSGTPASFTENAAVSDLAGAIDKAAREVAGRLKVRADAIAEAHATVPINLEAYATFLRAQALMHTERVADAQSAIELSRRATVLDPRFARAYVALARALQSTTDLGESTAAQQKDAMAEARSAVDRALTLDPRLGEAVIQRATLTLDSTQAEALYREGLQLAPNYGEGHQRYAEFLFDDYRRGEALEWMDRALELDPLDPRRYMRDALYHFFTNSDVVAFDRLMTEALAIDPKIVSALFQLGTSKHVFSGEFAEGIKLLEQAIVLDPVSDELKIRVATLYLDVDDPAAALAVLKQCEGKPRALIELAQYGGDRRRAADLAKAQTLEAWRTMWAVPEATALRDQAISTGDFSTALDLESKRFAMTVPWGAKKSGPPREWNRGLSLVYAHTLVASGDTVRGRKLAGEILAQLDGESVGRPQFFFSRDRAAAYAILGDKDRAIEELRNSLGIHHYYLWWYLADHDPLYAGLRDDPRFQALAAQAKQHRVEQRALLDEMRRTGQVPKR